MAPYLAHLRQTVTLWMPQGDGFGEAIVFSPDLASGGARWTPKRFSKYTKESERKSQPGVTILVNPPSLWNLSAAVGGILARGAYPFTSPFSLVNTTDLWEIIEYRETANLLDQYEVKRFNAISTLGQMRQTVTVWPMVRQETDRAYFVERAPSPLYVGPASVDVLNSGENGGALTNFAESHVMEYNAVVTLPRSSGVDAFSKYEIVWDSPFGTLVLESQAPLFRNDQSPFWFSLASILRRAQTETLGS